MATDQSSSPGGIRIQPDMNNFYLVKGTCYSIPCELMFTIRFISRGDRIEFGAQQCAQRRFLVCYRLTKFQ
jgi:hypothetical protein